jgi:benzoyl-CoA reductase/2-hydroxyglutaryl-CoA dehydratase subunit BcrC/BadD/HgdB
MGGYHGTSQKKSNLERWMALETLEKNKIRPINRLKSMYALRAEVDKMYVEAEQAKSQGKPVAWAMVGEWAEPILSAMDVLTVYPENYGSVCASTGKAAPYLELSDAEGFPTHLCGYARNSYGYVVKMMENGGNIPPDAPMGGMPRPDLLVGSGEICDARFKWFQAFGHYFNAPVWIIETSYPGLRESLELGNDELNIQFIIKNLREFVNFLEQFLGKKMDWDKLDAINLGSDRIKRIRWEINRLRRARPGPMHSRDFWSSMPAALLQVTDERAVLTGFQKMRDEIKERIDKGIAGINMEEKFRLSFDGLPPWHSLNIFDKLAERGWNFITEYHYNPRTPVNINMGNYSDPLERLVRVRYYQSTNNLLEVEFNPQEAALIREEILRNGSSPRMDVKRYRDYQCDGIVMHILLTCRGGSYYLPEIQQKVMDILKIPTLVIEGDMVDASSFNQAEIMQRAEAFEETMLYYRKVRKEIGMPW